MFVEAQFSIYPLREEHLSPAINEAIEIIKSFGLPVESGSMSSITYGESEKVFKAMQKVMDTVGENRHLVLIVTFSNACPVPLKQTPTEKKK